MGGAFQTSREIFIHPIWQDITKFRIFFFIVGNAVFSDEGITIANVHINRGQYLRSYRNLCDDLQYIENRKIKKYAISVISRKIDSLVKEKRLKIEDTELGTLFTVVNYDMYQGFDHYKKKELGTELEQGWNGDGTELEQGWNNNNNVNKDKKVKKKDSSPKQVYDEESIPYKLAKYLCESIKKNLPEYKDPNFQSWADDMRKIVELDNRDHKQVAKVIKWIQTDNFWWKNIMSPATLRKQYDRMLAEIKASSQQPVKQKTAEQIRQERMAESVQAEMALNRWISEGNNPEDFNYVLKND
jgi:hypothetical protein